MVQPIPLEPHVQRKSIAVIGNPNSGKSTLFNALTGLNAQTGNFPGTTVEGKHARIRLDGIPVELIDLPGAYSLQAATPDEQVASDYLLGCIVNREPPDALLVTVDASNLERNLFLASQVLELGMPTVIALTMVDIAERHGMRINTEKLSGELGCPVLAVNAKAGKGIAEIKIALLASIGEPEPPPRKDCLDLPACDSCTSCAFNSRFNWTEDVTSRVVSGEARTTRERTDRIDSVLTHPKLGLLAFMVVMLTIFYLIFRVAQIPMELIDGLFGTVGAWVEGLLPPGDFRNLLVQGVIGGVGGMLIFLPQIGILFFFLALLEDTGYMARAAFVMDRLMRRVGLPGTAFVPMVSAHACAIPAIMSTRIIGDPRDRLLTILVLPLMTCSARIPVYAMVTALLFPNNHLLAALVFCGAISLGVIAALVMAFIFRHTILPGESKPLILELPGYKLPSLRNAVLYTVDRSWVFIKQAGTIILMISIILWVLATYPKSGTAPGAVVLLEQAESLKTSDAAGAARLEAQAARESHRYALEQSMAGRMGKCIEPIVRPLGFDWQIGIGIISSFAAREVIVSTLSVVYGMGEEGADEPEGLYASMRKAKGPDGKLKFNTATCLSLLVFYVLAMQCLPTQAVTKRETNSWKWAAFQLGYMSVLAYVAALMTYQLVSRLG